MANITEESVAQSVRQTLQARPPLGHRLAVIDKDVRHEDDWWYVPVSPEDDRDPAEGYYDFLADVEDELRDKQGLNVTLLPTSNNVIKLVPRRSILRPLHVLVKDWDALRSAAGLSPKTEYDAAECLKFAAALGTHPAPITFDPPSWRAEVQYFFEHCEGIELR